MRSYKAAKRAAKKEPVVFEVAYDDFVEDPATGKKELQELTELFTCSGDISTLTLSEFGAAADLTVADAEGASVLSKVFREAFGDDVEYKRFWRFQSKHIEDDGLIEIMGDLIEDLTGRPTVRPSESPASSSTTGPGSRVVSLPGGFSVAQTPESEPLASSG